MKKNFKLIAVCIIVVAVITATLLLPIKQWLIDLLQYTQNLGLWAPVVVAAFYIIACILFLPGSVLTLGAGFIFKLTLGTITVSIGSTLGACAAFLVGRTIGRKWIAKKVDKNEKFIAIDNAVAKQGFRIVLLIRLSPLFPFNFLNYAFGLTKVPFTKYALASWIGMLPGTIMYVYFGAGLRSLADAAAGKVETGIAGQISFWIGLIITIAVTLFVTKIAKNALTQAAPTKSIKVHETQTE